MKKTILLIVLTLIFTVSACRSQPAKYTLGVFSAENAANFPAGIVTLGVEQNVAYTLAQAARINQFDLTLQPESALTDDVQVAVRGLVEHKDTPVLALIGATTNVGTTRLATLANAFSLPLIIPSAIGDNLLPANNLWAFQLSAPGSEHARFLFGQVLTRQQLIALQEESATPPENPAFRLGILYEQNTFGESAAVETAKAAMAQGIQIGYYGNFTPNAPEDTRLRLAFESMQKSGIHLLYIIASNPDDAQSIIRVARNFFVAGEAPLLLGQSGGFASQQFLQSPEARGVIILRQQIVRNSQCPNEIESLAQAQSYAALYLLNAAIELATTNNPQPNGWFSDWRLSAPDMSVIVRAQREKIREQLRTQATLNLPCLGPTSFDNNGQNKNLVFEFLYAENAAPSLVSEDRIRRLIETQLKRSPFE